MLFDVDPVSPRRTRGKFRYHQNPRVFILLSSRETLLACCHDRFELKVVSGLRDTSEAPSRSVADANQNKPHHNRQRDGIGLILTGLTEDKIPGKRLKKQAAILRFLLFGQRYRKAAGEFFGALIVQVDVIQEIGILRPVRGVHKRDSSRLQLFFQVAAITNPGRG